DEPAATGDRAGVDPEPAAVLARAADEALGELGRPEGADPLRGGGCRSPVGRRRWLDSGIACDRLGDEHVAVLEDEALTVGPNREQALERRREAERDLRGSADARAEEPARVASVRRPQRPAVPPVDGHRLAGSHRVGTVTFVTVRQKLRTTAVTFPVWRMRA